MRLNLWSANLIAMIAITMMPVANTASAPQTNPSSSTVTIENAAKREAWIFKGYVAFLVVIGLATAGFTVALWVANNRYQDAVAQDARARIAEAESVGAKAALAAAAADERAGLANVAAAHANERAEILEKDNLLLEASIAPRRLNAKQQGELARVRAFLNPVIKVRSYVGDTEGFILASQIVDALSKSRIRIDDDRNGTIAFHEVVFGVSFEGSNNDLVNKLRSILGAGENDLTKATPPISIPPTSPASRMYFERSSDIIPSATIVVGAKPIK
jgi:hypothetical protein